MTFFFFGFIVNSLDLLGSHLLDGTESAQLFYGVTLVVPNTVAKPNAEDIFYFNSAF